MNFQPLPLQEVLDVVLPSLVYERWSFNAKEPADREMGEDIWRKVRSNFRRLSSLIDTANIVAIAQNQPKITLPLLQTVYTQFMASEDWLYAHPSKSSRDADTPAGPHEELSQQRHQAKEEKGKKGNSDAK